MKQTPKILMYGQSLLGLGHMTRSLWLSKLLIQHYQVDFIDGGFKPPFTIDSDHFQFLPIPRVFIQNVNDSRNYNFEINQTADSLKDVKEKRIYHLEQVLVDPYQILIIESFPFTKIHWKSEISFLIKKVKSLNPNCKIICLLDPHHLMFFFRKTPKIRSEILSFTKEHIDFIFCSSDPKVDPQAKKATKLLNLSSKLHYTGYFCDPDTPEHTSAKDKKNIISIYLRKHVVKIKQIQSIAQAAKQFPDYEFHIYETASLPETLNESYKDKIKAPKNFCFRDFTDHFGKAISESKLLITSGKSAINTAIRTNTPTLVVYLQKFPQIERYKAFDHTGLLSPLYPQDFSPKTIAEKINAALNTSPPDRIDIDMNGAENTLNLIKKLCS